jgi:hypothetical protein
LILRQCRIETVAPSRLPNDSKGRTEFGPVHPGLRPRQGAFCANPQKPCARPAAAAAFLIELGERIAV